MTRRNGLTDALALRVFRDLESTSFLTRVGLWMHIVGVWYWFVCVLLIILMVFIILSISWDGPVLVLGLGIPAIYASFRSIHSSTHTECVLIRSGLSFVFVFLSNSHLAASRFPPLSLEEYGSIWSYLGLSLRGWRSPIPLLPPAFPIWTSLYYRYLIDSRGGFVGILIIRDLLCVLIPLIFLFYVRLVWFLHHRSQSDWQLQQTRYHYSLPLCMFSTTSSWDPVYLILDISV